jgi:hypothetical protein
MVREHFLGKGLDAPDLATVKVPLIPHRHKPRQGSRETYRRLPRGVVLCQLSRVTGTPTDEGEKSEVYDVS